MKFYSAQKGFSLIELMVVIAIIGLLSSVVFVSYNKARQQSRDDVRKADIEQLALMLRLYIEDAGADVDCVGGMKIDGSTEVATIANSGVRCRDGEAILDFIESQMGTVPSDPKGPNNSEYYYYFDGRHSECSNKALLFAHELEAGDTNKSDVCSSTGNNGGLGTADQPWLRELPFVR